VQREKLGPNIFEQLEAALDGNGKALESGPLMIESAAVESEPADGDSGDDE
jgi:hypothetical protein